MTNHPGERNGHGLLTGSRAPASGLRPGASSGRIPTGQPLPPRLAYSGARLLLTPDAPRRPRTEELERFIDWDASWALRLRLAQRGLGLAEALDLAQREALGWPVLQRLIREHATRLPGAAFLVGVTADHLPPGRLVDELIEGVAFQAQAVAEAGGVPVILPLRLLARRRATESEFVQVFETLLERVDGPLLIDWTGPARMALLEGCFPGHSFERILALDPTKVRGARLSWLDPRTVVRLRRLLAPQGQVLFTGDDPLFVRWILGGHPGAGDAAPGQVQGSTEFAGTSVSLGDFAHVAMDLLEVGGPAFLAATGALETGDVAAFTEAIAPFEALARAILARPDRLHPAIAFLAWLDGRQPDARFAGDWNAPALGMLESRRLHDLAAAAGIFADPAAAWAHFQSGA